MKEDRPRIQEYQKIIAKFPTVNKTILKSVLALSHDIEQNQKVTKMTSHNVAIVLAPTLLRSKTEDLESMLRNSTIVVQILKEMIDNHEALFAEDDESMVIRGRERSQSTGGGEAIARLNERAMLETIKSQLETLLQKEELRRAELEETAEELHEQVEALQAELKETKKKLEDATKTKDEIKMYLEQEMEQRKKLDSEVNRLKSELEKEKQKLAQMSISKPSPQKEITKGNSKEALKETPKESPKKEIPKEIVKETPGTLKESQPESPPKVVKIIQQFENQKPKRSRTSRIMDFFMVISLTVLAFFIVQTIVHHELQNQFYRNQNEGILALIMELQQAFWGFVQFVVNTFSPST